MQTVLTIAGFDPSSGAGITADLMVFAAHSLFGTSCITALTVQNTVGVSTTQPVSAENIASTLNCLRVDLPPVGIKIGMLANAEVVLTVSSFLSSIRRHGNPIVVLDPVMRSSSGSDLLDNAGQKALRSELLPLVDWVTPNVGELGMLLGRPPIESQDDIAGAAAELQEFGKQLTVVVTGGHLDPPDDLLLEPLSSLTAFSGERIRTSSTHGTGCAFSSALLSRLVLGDDPRAAVRSAKNYVAEAMRTAVPIGHGRGPMNLLWPILQAHPATLRE